MFKFIRNFLSYRRFVKLANSVGFDLKNPTPIEALAFQTMARFKMFPNQEPCLKHNDLTLYDSIIFTLFWIRMLCLDEIKDRKSAEMFSNQYVHYVLKFFPEGAKIAKKYDADFFEHRANYYDSILADDTKSSDEKIQSLVDAFSRIIVYDYSGKYVRFNDSTPLMISDVFEMLKINIEIKIYFQTLPDFFNSPMQDVIEYYNK